MAPLRVSLISTTSSTASASSPAKEESATKQYQPLTMLSSSSSPPSNNGEKNSAGSSSHCSSHESMEIETTSLVSLAENVSNRAKKLNNNTKKNGIITSPTRESHSISSLSEKHFTPPSTKQNNSSSRQRCQRDADNDDDDNDDSDNDDGDIAIRKSYDTTPTPKTPNFAEYAIDEEKPPPFKFQRVRFAQHANIIPCYIPNLADIPSNESAEKWVLRNELESIRTDVVRIARESKLYYGNQLLDSTYISDFLSQQPEQQQQQRQSQQRNKHQERQHQQALVNQQQLSSKITQAQIQLGLWCRHCDSRRGLECGMNYDHKIERRMRHKISIRSILQAQHRMKRNYQIRQHEQEEQNQQQEKDHQVDLSSSTSSFSSQEEYISSELAKLSIQLNQPAKQFAEMMGRADEYAVQIELEDVLDDTAPESFKSRRPDVVKLNEMVLIKHSTSNENLVAKYPEAQAA